VKLVRDRIPELAAATGQPGTSRQATEAEFALWLRAKLLEEAQEAATASPATLVEELGDSLQVLYALAEQAGLAAAEIECARARKARTHGTYTRRLIWQSTTGLSDGRPRRGERPWTCASSTAPAPTCGHRFGQPDDPGRKRRFCSDACKQAAYRQRKRAREQARQQAQDGAHRRAREDARRARDRARRSPPPHAGTSRPGRWCGPAAATAGRIPSTTTGPPTTAPSAAMTVDTPRRSRPGSPRRPPPAGPRPSSSAPSTAWRRRTDRNAPLDRAR
jgi:predicted house-cleaning noncanonical NTP pyrophosphatase (MazG superfamily)